MSGNDDLCQLNETNSRYSKKRELSNLPILWIPCLPGHQLYPLPRQTTSGSANDAFQMPYPGVAAQNDGFIRKVCTIYLECFHESDRFMTIISWDQYSTESSVFNRLHRHTLAHFQISVFAHHADLRMTEMHLLTTRTPYFSNQECAVSLANAAMTQNSHSSFRFTSPSTVPSLIWSSLEFIKVLYVWRQQPTSNAVCCLAPVTACAQSYGSTSCLQVAIKPSSEDWKRAEGVGGSTSDLYFALEASCGPPKSPLDKPYPACKLPPLMSIQYLRDCLIISLLMSCVP